MRNRPQLALISNASIPGSALERQPSWKSWLEIGRVSNLPTCLSGATAGFYLGGGSIADAPVTWIAVSLVAILLYEAGSVLNDVADFEVDKVVKPTRPLPSGRIRRRDATIVSGLFGATALAITALLIPSVLVTALALVALIITFDLTHSSFGLAPLLRGACRGGVYLLGAAAAGWNFLTPSVWLMAATLVAYVMFVDLVGREESKSGLTVGQLAAAWLLPFTLVVPLFASPTLSELTLFALGGALTWVLSVVYEFTRGSRATEPTVNRLIAGIALVDGLVIAVIGSVEGLVIAWFSFLWTMIWFRKARPVE